MRISDWSSDVCSSDLRRLGPRAPGLRRLGGRLQKRLQLIVRDSARIELRLARDRLGEQPAVVLARDLHHPEAAEVRRGELGIAELEAAPAQAQHELGEGGLETGRAPCWDSVGQYGWISGVAI